MSGSEALKSKGIMSDVWLVIPAFNVAPYLDALLSLTSYYIPTEKTVLVDDGSRDGTGEVARRRGVRLITHTHNRGKGAALRSGIELAAQQGAKWVMTMDGDCQHDPAAIPDFLAAAKGGADGGAGGGWFDLIIGSRPRAGSQMPLDRRLSNALSSLLLSIIVRRRLEDVQCGYRMIRVGMLSGLTFSSDRYDFETELLLRLIRRGARIGWVKVPTHYGGAPSSIRRQGDTMRFLKVLWRYVKENVTADRRP